ncbi:hypothetical protein ACHAW6_012973 [Cyclotella cf. meneghiniana]
MLRSHQKSTPFNKYAPVLKYTSLRLLTSKAVSDKRVLQQGNCKSAFCQASLPDDELTVVRPPVGDLAYSKDEYWLLRKTLYGLRRSPHHWYNKITAILQGMGLQPSPHNPCLYQGIVTSSTATNSTPPSHRKPIHVGLYVDDFVFYSESTEEEQFFRQTLSSQCNVEFMGPLDYFLGTAFTWQHHKSGNLSVHLSQTVFTEYITHCFAVDNMNPIPQMTPYRSGFPIDAIPPPNPGDPDQKQRTKCYQSIVGCINWLATCTRPDVSPFLNFLASYSNNPAPQHYKAALHAVKYLLSTSEYGISFHSNATSTVQAFNHFPHHHDKEAYSDATPPPSPSDCYNLTGFSDACWGGQFGNAVADSTPLEMFKYCSLILAIDACVVELLHIKHCAMDLGIADAQQTITIYSDNQAAVNWAAVFTTKGTKYINLHENCVREAHYSKIVKITHIPGVINASDLFTKELKDAAHYHCC